MESEICYFRRVRTKGSQKELERKRKAAESRFKKEAETGEVIDPKTAAGIVGTSYKSYMRWRKAYSEGKSLEMTKLEGPKPKLSEDQWTEVAKLIAATCRKRRWTLKMVSDYVADRHKQPCHASTVSRNLPLDLIKAAQKAWQESREQRQAKFQSVKVWYRKTFGEEYTSSPPHPPHSPPAAKPIDTKAPSAGKVLMAMGARGYTFDQAKRYTTAKKCALSDNSIRWYLSTGKTGKRGKPAKLTAEQWAEVKKLAGPKTPWPKTVKSTIY
jgi:transposase